MTINIHPTTFILRNRPVGFVLMRKNGSSSLQKVIREIPGSYERMISEPSKLRLPRHSDVETIVAIVREPLARLISGWKYWNQHLKTVSMKEGFPDVSANLDTFLNDVVERGPDNLDQHFRHQYYQLAPNGELIPTDILKLENIGDDWAVLQKKLARNPHRIHLPDFIHKGQSQPREMGSIDKQTLERVFESFHKDYEAFNYAIPSPDQIPCKELPSGV